MKSLSKHSGSYVRFNAFLAALTLCLMVSPFGMDTVVAQSGSQSMDKFDKDPQSRWRFFSDQVMGGVSEGRLSFGTKDQAQVARMQGRVSTANNGGFIQFRKELDKSPSANIKGVELKVRANNQPYYIHLRTSGTKLPWQYYQAKFQATPEWRTIRLPLSAFEASSRWTRKTPKATSLRSIGVVAYGRNHDALIEVAEIGFY